MIRLALRPAQRVDHDEQFHQIVVRRMAGELDDEHILATHIFVDFDENLVVGKAADAGIGQWQAEIISNAFRPEEGYCCR